MNFIWGWAIGMSCGVGIAGILIAGKDRREAALNFLLAHTWPGQTLMYFIFCRAVKEARADGYAEFFRTGGDIIAIFKEIVNNTEKASPFKYNIFRRPMVKRMKEIIMIYELTDNKYERDEPQACVNAGSGA